MTKPFGIEELLARINATLRAEPTGAAGAVRSRRVTAGDVEIDLAARKVTKGGDLVHLTPTEFALLREFVSNPGVLLTHATLLRRVWGAATRRRPSTPGSTWRAAARQARGSRGTLAVHHRAAVRLSVHLPTAPISGPSRFSRWRQNVRVLFAVTVVPCAATA